MDAPLSRRHRHSERWSERLPGAYFTRIVLPIDFARSTPSVGLPLHVIGDDARGDPCYCHFVCQFGSPRCFRSARRRLGEAPLLITARELHAWRMKAGGWFVCVVDRPQGSPHLQARYSMRKTMPESVCLDDDGD